MEYFFLGEKCQGVPLAKTKHRRNLEKNLKRRGPFFYSWNTISGIFATFRDPCRERHLSNVRATTRNSALTTVFATGRRSHAIFSHQAPDRFNVLFTNEIFLFFIYQKQLRKPLLRCLAELETMEVS